MVQTLAKPPPVLVGYLKEKGHDAGKILHILNSFYDHLTESEGVESMPKELFKARKDIINKICNSPKAVY